MWQLNELNTYCVGVYQSDVQKVFKQSQLINSEPAAGEFTNIKRPSFLHYPLLPLLCHSFLLWRNSPHNHSRSRRITIIINGSSFRLNLADIICPSTATRSTWNGNFCGGSLVLINWRRRPFRNRGVFRWRAEYAGEHPVVRFHINTISCHFRLTVANGNQPPSLLRLLFLF